MEEVKKIYKLIPQAIGKIGAIAKNGTNTHQNYKFRSIDDMYNNIQPILPELGLFFIPNVLESKEEVFESIQKFNDGNTKTTRSIRVKQKIEYTICADDGSSIKSIVEGEALDTSDKATNKAMTAAFKYMLIQVFCIAIKELEDADATSPEIPAKPNQENKPAAKPTKEKVPNMALSAKDPFVFEGGRFQGQKFADIMPEDFDGELKKYEDVQTKSKNLQALIDRMKKFKSENQKAV